MEIIAPLEKQLDVFKTDLQRARSDLVSESLQSSELKTKVISLTEKLDWVEGMATRKEVKLKEVGRNKTVETKPSHNESTTLQVEDLLQTTRLSDRTKEEELVSRGQQLWWLKVGHRTVICILSLRVAWTPLSYVLARLRRNSGRGIWRSWKGEIK